MTPSMEPTTVSAPGLTVVPARLLDEGEIVILAIKPSGWFCVLVSLPVLVVAAAVAVGAYVAGGLLPGWPHPAAVGLVAICAAAARLVVGWLQWLGRLYVLTNRRLIRLAGVVGEDVHQCPLKPLARAAISATWTERVVHVASMSFESDHPAAADADWAHISHAHEVHKIVSDAIAQAK